MNSKTEIHYDDFYSEYTLLFPRLAATFPRCYNLRERSLVMFYIGELERDLIRGLGLVLTGVVLWALLISTLRSSPPTLWRKTLSILAVFGTVAII